jgi:glutathione S-transferase
MQVPYLADPNTSTELFESADIVAYLEATYAKH